MIQMIINTAWQAMENGRQEARFEEPEVLNAQARDLEQTIAGNVAEILES